MEVNYLTEETLEIFHGIKSYHGLLMFWFLALLFAGLRALELATTIEEALEVSLMIGMLGTIVYIIRPTFVFLGRRFT